MWKVYFNLTKPSPLEANSEINEMKVSVSRGSDQLVVELAEACGRMTLILILILIQRV